MIAGSEPGLDGIETGIMMKIYYYSSHNGRLLSTGRSLGVLLMILSFVFIEGLLWAWPGILQAQEMQQ